MQTKPEDKNEKLADDLIFGARAIGDEIGRSRSQVYYLAGTQRLPIGRLGKMLFASRAKLRSATKALTSA